ncbi:UNVERIFIED_CONTAM: Glucuronokinase [Sesamum radiatum]|uniref:Glucuronokinase n=1 Tax=Sesamum radiatum TaxID=300843 RepID=A0AAW2VQM2_SESRA
MIEFSKLFVLIQSCNFHDNRLQTDGYYGGVRLLMAICRIFHRHCKDNGISLHERNFTLSYDTNIPRQTGLSGSSAIVCAALSCLLDFYQVRNLIKVEVRPNLILNAEKELGIVAGLQDRVAQVYGGLVYMDFDKKRMEELGHGEYTVMDLNLLPPLYLIYAENPSDSGKANVWRRGSWSSKHRDGRIADGLVLQQSLRAVEALLLYSVLKDLLKQSLWRMHAKQLVLPSSRFKSCRLF